MRHSKQVWACSEQRGVGLHPSDRREKCIAAGLLCEPPVQIAQPARRPLYRKERIYIEAALTNLVCQLVGVVEVGRREPIRMPLGVSVLSFANVSFDNRVELRLGDKSANEPIVGRCESRDCSRNEEAARTQDSSCLGERGETILRLREVVERAKEQDDIDRVIGPGQMACITDLSTRQFSGPRNGPSGLRLLDVRPSRVDHSHRRQVAA